MFLCLIHYRRQFFPTRAKRASSLVAMDVLIARQIVANRAFTRTEPKLTTEADAYFLFPGCVLEQKYVLGQHLTLATSFDPTDLQN